MPGLSGVELQAQVARVDEHLPVVFLTGHLDAALRTGALASDAVDFLQKPIGDQYLLAAIERAVERRRANVSITPPS